MKSVKTWKWYPEPWTNNLVSLEPKEFLPEGKDKTPSKSCEPINSEREVENKIHIRRK